MKLTNKRIKKQSDEDENKALNDSINLNDFTLFKLWERF